MPWILWSDVEVRIAWLSVVFAVSGLQIEIRRQLTSCVGKKASESSQKTSPGTAPSATSDTTTIGNTPSIPHFSAKGSTQTHSSTTTTALSHEPNVVTKTTKGSVPPALKDSLSSLSTNVQGAPLPNSRGGFSAATSSSVGFVHQGPDQTWSLSLPSR